MRTSALFLLVTLAACRVFHAEAPTGFAAYEGSDRFRAVSPDGVVYRVRQERNKPEADLPFWKEALKKRMLDAGYQVQREGDIKAKGGEPGALLELSAPLGTVDYSYLVAIYVKGGHIIIAEAAGDVLRVKDRHDALVAALQATELK